MSKHKFIKNKPSVFSSNVGKAYLLSGHRDIVLYPSRSKSAWYTYNNKNRPKSLTEAERKSHVVLVEEGTSRVKVLTANGRLGWLSRSYIKSEVSDASEKVLAQSTGEIIARIVSLYETSLKSKLDSKEKHAITEIISDIRKLFEASTVNKQPQQ